MKPSVGIPGEDVDFLDAYVAERGFASRSAVLHRAVRLRRAAELGPAYEEAFAEWEETGAATEWDVVAADGLASDAAR